MPAPSDSLERQIGRTVASELVRAGCTQETAAFTLGLSKSAFTRRIAGDGRGFTAADLALLALFLEIHVADLYPERVA